MNRAKPRTHSKCVTSSDEKPTASELPRNTVPTDEKKPRRSVDVLTAGVGAMAYSGLAGIGGTSIFPLAGFALSPCPCLAASALEIGPGFDDLRAAARILAVSLGPVLAAGAGFAALAAAGLAGELFAAGAALGAAFGAAFLAPSAPRAAASISATDISPGFFAGPAAGFDAAGLSSLPPPAAFPPPSAPRAAASISATDISPGFLPDAKAAGFCSAAGCSAAADFSGAAGSAAPSSLADAAPPAPSLARQAARMSSTDMLSRSAIRISLRNNGAKVWVNARSNPRVVE